MGLKLTYDFSNYDYRLGRELVKINYPKFEYYVDEDENNLNISLETLKNIHKDEALEEAAIKTLIEYSHFIGQ